MLIRLSEHIIDTDRREIRRHGQPVHVEPQVFDLLVYLIGNSEHVVSKDELFATVWRGRIVSDATLASRINAARAAIGDSGERQEQIRTVPRRGFRFVGAFSREDAPLPAGASTTDIGEPDLRQEVTFCIAPDGTRLAMAAVGSGPILVKTGSWLNHLEFDWESPVFFPLLRKLAQHSSLVRFDARGTGLSDWNIGEAPSFDEMVSDLETVVDAMELREFSLFGMSQGAAIAIAYAARHPQRVRKLVIVGGYSQGRNMRGSESDAREAEALMTMMRLGWGDEHSAFMQAFSSIYVPKGTPEQIEWFTQLQRKAASADNAVRLRTIFDNIDVSDLLSRLTTPTLVLHSRHDSVVPYEQGRMLAAAIPNAKFVSLASENHVVLQDEPAWSRMTEEIERFLQ
ncbi:MAG: alpha/beta fold hydrolase [Salinarimonadaceae bacterium]|nr:MAG: alpha/beta fold hydrolase [Salinarimonadaceae bacterium]